MRPVFVRCKHLACEIKRAGYHNANRPPGELPAAGKCGLEACDRCRGDAFAMGEFGERGSLVGILLPWNFERRGNFGQSLKVTQKAASVFCGLHADEEGDGGRNPFQASGPDGRREAFCNRLWRDAKSFEAACGSYRGSGVLELMTAEKPRQWQIEKAVFILKNQ